MRRAPRANPSSLPPLVGLIAGLLATLALPASAATVATDKADYAPGETVVITGSGWEPGDTVVLVLHEDPQLDPDLQLTAVADANGDFTNSDFIVDVFDIGVTFTLTATGDPSGLTADTTFTDAPGTCGDGVVQSGEQCDLGAANGNGSSCCKNNCTFANAHAACTDDGNPCTVDECTGTSAICQHTAGNAGTVCRSLGDCDVPETCTGTSAACPAETGQVKPAGTPCPDDGNPCTLDQCDGIQETCQHPAGNPGTVCRAAAGVCDMAESCTGTSSTCPADAKQPAGTA